MTRSPGLSLILLLIANAVFAQIKNEPGKPISIQRATEDIILDGNLEERSWSDADVATSFFLNFPYDTALADFQTEARVTFDDNNLYVSFVCYDDATPDVIQSLRRDFDFGVNDNVSIIMGPYNDALNGFFFTTTPMGVQLEGTVSGGGASGDSYNSTWDNKWYNKVVKSGDRWVAEIAIPFKSFRYKAEAEEETARRAGSRHLFSLFRHLSPTQAS